MTDSIYMKRCLELAKNGSGFTSPNPMVGSIIVYDSKIIGEGYHVGYGEPHAEVMAINNAVSSGSEEILPLSTLYVNLEPCAHQGKTPPCSDFIIKSGIKKVVIGGVDPFSKVNGAGIRKLNSTGVKTETGILEAECELLNKRFFTYHRQKRPYIILKFARTSNNYISMKGNERVKISNEYSDILVHKWRSEEAAILVGTRTAEKDNPRLNVRKWFGKNPVRITIDKTLRLDSSLNLFDRSAFTIIFNGTKDHLSENLEFIKLDFYGNIPQQILKALWEREILSVIIEGGSNILSQFIGANLWDEANIITSEKMFEDGIPAPDFHGELYKTIYIMGDKIDYFLPKTKV